MPKTLRRRRPLLENDAGHDEAFSADGGKTWEVNWIATDTRINGNLGGAPH